MSKPEVLSTQFVYPEYEEKEANVVRDGRNKHYCHVIKLTTHVRKKYNGIWYLIPVIINDESEFDNEMDYHKFIKEANNRAIRRLIYDTYFVMAFYIIDLNILTDDHRPVIFEDESQIDEKERVIPHLVIPQFNQKAKGH